MSGDLTQWIDNHCHLSDDPTEAAEVLADARSAGVIGFIDVGCDLATSTAAIAHAAAHENVFATVGLHPHESKHGLDGLAELLGADNVVAVGEAGLDYHYDHSPRDVQKQMFAAQIALAHEHELPLVIHTREAWDDTFDILDAEGVPERTIFHCFTGGVAEARAGLERGAYLSFSGIVSFKSATDVQSAAQMCPLDRILVETDSPYLAPAPHRGKQNRPQWVARVGEVVAELRSMPVAELATATVVNTRSAYPRLR